MALFQPRADRAHVWQGDAPQRKCLSAMYNDHERGAVYAVSDTVYVLRTTQSRGFLVVRREQRVQQDRPRSDFERRCAASPQARTRCPGRRATRAYAERWRSEAMLTLRSLATHNPSVTSGGVYAVN